MCKSGLLRIVLGGRMKNYDFVDEKPATKIINFKPESAIQFLKEMFESEVSKMRKKAEAFQVTDHKTMDTAIEMINQAKKLINRVEKERKRIKAPYLKFTKGLDGMAKNVKEPITEIIDILDVKIKPIAIMIKEAEERRLAREREARLAAEAEAEKKRAAGQVVLDVPTAPTVPEREIAEGKFTTGEGSAKLEFYMDWNVVDFDAVPRKYKKLIIDEDKLDADIQAGVEVPGVRATRESKLKTRVSNK